MKKEKFVVGSFVFGAMMILPLPSASADPPGPHNGDPNLCASNPAFHNAHDADNKDKHCQDTAMNDFGGGGAPNSGGPPPVTPPTGGPGDPGDSGGGGGTPGGSGGGGTGTGGAG